MFNEAKVFLNKNYWISVYLIAQERIAIVFGRSATGIFLPIIKPTIHSLLYAFALNRVAGIEMENYTLFVMTGVSIWNFICSIIIFSGFSFNANINIIRVKPISKTAFTLAFVFERLYIDGIAILISFLCMMLFFDMHITLILPLVLFYFSCVVIFCCFIGVALSYISLYSLDLIQILSSFIPLCLWVTPIMYPIEKMTGKLGLISELNPFYILINPIVQIIYYERLPTLMNNIYLFVLLLISGVISYFIYKKLSRNAIYYMM